MNTTSVQRQRMNCQPPTRAKARGLVVTTILPAIAYVEGGHDAYEVNRDTLRCSCEAGQRGLRCSHALAVIKELARLRGALVMWAFSLKHANSWAALQQKKGKHAYVCVRGQYTWVETQDMPVYHAVRPILGDEELITTTYQANKDRLARTRTGNVEQDVEVFF